MKMSLSLGIILCSFVVIVVGFRIPANFEEYVLEELAKRHSRSSEKIASINSLEWLQQQPQQNEIRNNDEYSQRNEISTKNDLQKKLLPMEMLKRRLDLKEQAIKRNSATNANYYMQLCHFKICNMGKRRSRYWQ